MGSFTPVDECTQVTATTRVRGETAASSRPTSPSALAAAGASYSATLRTTAPLRAACRRRFSWVA
jgi:hypothetical protein